MFNIEDFAPLNGHIVLEDLPEEKKEKDQHEVLVNVFSGDSKRNKKKEERYKMFKIVTVGIDCKPRIRESGKNRYALVETNMVEDFMIGDLKMKIVHENYIIGIFVPLDR